MMIRIQAHYCPQCGAPIPNLAATPPPPALPPVVSGTVKADFLGVVATEVKAAAGHPVLTVSISSQTQQQTYPLVAPCVRIGRKDPANDINIDSPVISRHHLELRAGPGGYELHHQHTTNGLIYQGQPIAGAQSLTQRLQHGDIIRIGSGENDLVTLVYRESEDRPLDQMAEPHILHLNPAALSYSIGRTSGNTFVLAHPLVSSRHAELSRNGGNLIIVDCRSTNGTFVNERRLTRPTPLRPNDVIRIGPYHLIYDGQRLVERGNALTVRIDVLGVTKYSGPDKKLKLLRDITLPIPPRSFVAIVGGSGAGKSTLMDALSGLRPAQEGTVQYNGQVYTTNGQIDARSHETFNVMLGYVPQDDIIHRDLTVERALHYAARLRLPADHTSEQIRQRVDEVLVDVEMTDRRKLLVSKLSGGQRKRVSIAVELLARPSIFFLDEPTSGLDPGLDYKMMQLLRRLADRGQTVVLVTHATNNIDICDYVCFLGRGGRMCYFGPPREARTYFGKSDFAQIYNALDLDEAAIDQQTRQFQQSATYGRYVRQQLRAGPGPGQPPALAGPARAPRVNPWNQFFLLMTRYVELLRNDRTNLLILAVQAPIIGLILSAISSPHAFQPGIVDAPRGGGIDAQMTLFLIACAAVWFGAINAAREIVKEAPIYRRERMVNLRLAPYLFSKIVVLGAICAIQSFILVWLINLRAPFQESIVFSPFFETYVTTWLAMLSGTMLGLALSATVRNNDQVMTFLPLVLVPQIIFGGVFYHLTNGVSRVIALIFPTRWGMQALGSSAGLHNATLSVDSWAYVHSAGHLFLVWTGQIILMTLLVLATFRLQKGKDVRMSSPSRP